MTDATTSSPHPTEVSAGMLFNNHFASKRRQVLPSHLTEEEAEAHKAWTLTAESGHWGKAQTCDPAGPREREGPLLALDQAQA